MPSKPTELDGLRKQCMDLGLNAKGTKAELIRRLKEKRSALEEGDRPSDSGLDMECDAVMVVRAEVGNEEDMK